MSVWHPFIRWQRFTMTMVMVMMMIMVVIVMVTATMAMVMVMMMVMIMMVMMFAMAVVMGVFVLHIFIHNKPPRGLRRPANNNKKTYSTFILFFKSTTLVGFKSYLLNMF